jgi:CPA2 family monovalent cation:H+ antiporter-2
VALGIAVGSAKLFGVSMALGAFLAGTVVNQSEFSLRAASEALPMRDAFAVLFFVSVGMLFQPIQLWEAPGLAAATLGVILLGKPLAALSIVLLLRHPPKVALAVAVALAQIGEFSFILALMGIQLGILPTSATNTLVAAAIVSIALNPILYRSVDPITGWAMRRPRLWAWLNRRVPAREPVRADRDSEETDEPHRAVVVGYGPVGQTVTRLLQQNEIEPVIIELNLETVRRLREQHISAVYGDAIDRDTLRSAGVDKAGSLILSASGLHGVQEVVRLARELNPDIQIVARSTYVRELSTLRQAGADAVFSGEGEVALALTVAILRWLGATPEQIDRERERVRADLFDRQTLATLEEAAPRAFEGDEVTPVSSSDEAAQTTEPSDEPTPSG